MEDGSTLRAKQVISSVGARMTFGTLLPAAQRAEHGYEDKLQKVKASGATLTLFLGFKGSAAELKLPKTNLWIYPTPDHEANVAAQRTSAAALGRLRCRAFMLVSVRCAAGARGPPRGRSVRDASSARS